MQKLKTQKNQNISVLIRMPDISDWETARVLGEMAADKGLDIEEIKVSELITLAKLARDKVLLDAVEIAEKKLSLA